MSNPIQHLADGNLEKFRETVHAVLYSKLGEALGQARQNIAEAVYGNATPPGVGSTSNKGKGKPKPKPKNPAKGSC